MARIRIQIELPPGFPEKYREAILRAVDQCSVKRHLAEPPRFEMTTIAAEPESSTPPDAESVPAELRPFFFLQ